MTSYSFDVEVATKYGLDEAVILWNLHHWLNHNAKNDKHVHDGKVWTYNSIAAWAELMPFWSEKQVRSRLDSMAERGIIEKGNYNRHKYDRTTWYTILAPELCILPNGEMEKTRQGNGIDKEGEPIPIINTDNKHNREGELSPKRINFTPPSIEEVISYVTTRRTPIDPVAFVNFYETKGWMVGKNKMKNWKACVRTWEQRENSGQPSQTNINSFVGGI